MSGRRRCYYQTARGSGLLLKPGAIIRRSASWKTSALEKQLSMIYGAPLPYKIPRRLFRLLLLHLLMEARALCPHTREINLTVYSKVWWLVCLRLCTVVFFLNTSNWSALQNVTDCKRLWHSYKHAQERKKYSFLGIHYSLISWPAVRKKYLCLTWQIKHWSYFWFFLLTHIGKCWIYLEWKNLIWSTA